MVQNSNQDYIHHSYGCMVCGSEIVYEQEMLPKFCYFCDSEITTNTFCKNGHFICDTCHAKDAISIIKQVCLHSTEKDMAKLVDRIRNHKSFSLHGPEHHAMVPGIILSAYRNMGRLISEDKLNMAIDRGAIVPGGSCGFNGACGAALGVGIAFSIILQATPLKPKERQSIMTVTSEVLKTTAQYEGARCCLRESITALNEAARLSEKYLDIKLKINDEYKCSQYPQVKECIKDDCKFWPGS